MKHGRKAWITKPEEIHDRAYDRIAAQYLERGDVREYLAETYKADQTYSRNLDRTRRYYEARRAAIGQKWY